MAFQNSQVIAPSFASFASWVAPLACRWALLQSNSPRVLHECWSIPVSIVSISTKCWPTSNFGCSSPSSGSQLSMFTSSSCSFVHSRWSSLQFNLLSFTFWRPKKFWMTRYQVIQSSPEFGTSQAIHLAGTWVSHQLCVPCAFEQQRACHCAFWLNPVFWLTEYYQAQLTLRPSMYICFSQSWTCWEILVLLWVDGSAQPISSSLVLLSLFKISPWSRYSLAGLLSPEYPIRQK